MATRRPSRAGKPATKETAPNIMNPGYFNEAKPSPAGAGQTEGSRIWETLRKIEARVDMLNERENLGSFALAGGRDQAMEPPRFQPPRADRISQLYSRVCDIERALFGEARG